MDQNYQYQQQPQQPLQQTPQFQYQAKQQIQLQKLIHSILIQSSRTKSIIPQCLIKRITENIGLECNQESFYNLMGAMTQFTLSGFLEEMKSVGEGSKNKKECVLGTVEVRKGLEEQGIFMMPSKVIPQMGISEDDGGSYNFQRN